MPKLYKLDDVYVAWNSKDIWLVPKTKGEPKHGHFFDADDWDQSDVAELFFDWFTILSVGFYEVPAHDPGDVFSTLSEIEEFNGLDDRLAKRQGKVTPRPLWMDQRPQV